MDDKSTISKLSKAFTLETRYENEYEEISLLGKGGFSSVYKVRNLLDYSLSAIKKIIIKVTNKNKLNIQKEVESVIQEIRCLAKIKSDFVVNYKLSWIEIKLKKTENIKTLNLNQSKSEEQSFELSYNTISLPKEDDFIEFHQSEDKGSLEEISIEEIHSDDEMSNNKKTFLGASNLDVDQIDNLIIYIQMELCKETLYDYIKRRNTLNKLTLESFLEINEKEILNLFLQICKALDFIHINEKLIHRDLKPKNIFFSENGEIKLGDFGLATYISCIFEDYSPVSSPKGSNQFGNRLSFSEEYKLYSELTEKNANDAISFAQCHTKNIGTPQYAAPEQLNQNYYDQKADIYSLGLVLFDLVYPFKTEMERRNLFDQVKQGKIPIIIKEKFPVISKLISSTICNDPNARPQAKELVILLTEYLNNFNRISLEFQSKADVSRISSRGRKRFLSEDITKFKSFELLMKDSKCRNKEWKNIWIKIVDQKLLFFNQSHAIKAMICYDINECQIKGRYIEEQEEIKIKEVTSISCKGKRSKSLTSSSISFKSKDDNENNHESIRQINYVIEIDDPYLHRCYIKSNNLFDSIDFYNQVLNVL